MKTVAVLLGSLLLGCFPTGGATAQDWAKGVWAWQDGPDSCLFIKTDKPLKSTYVFQCRSLGAGALFQTGASTLMGVIGDTEEVSRFVVVSQAQDDRMSITVLTPTGTEESTLLFQRVE